MIPVGTIIYWIEDAPDAPDKAREFCRSRGVTSEEVKIVRAMHGDTMMVMVKVRTPCKLKLPKGTQSEREEHSVSDYGRSIQGRCKDF